MNSPNTHSLRSTPTQDARLLLNLKRAASTVNASSLANISNPPAPASRTLQTIPITETQGIATALWAQEMLPGDESHTESLLYSSIVIPTPIRPERGSFLTFHFPASFDLTHPATIDDIFPTLQPERPSLERRPFEIGPENTARTSNTAHNGKRRLAASIDHPPSSGAQKAEKRQKVSAYQHHSDDEKLALLAEFKEKKKVAAGPLSARGFAKLKSLKATSITQWKARKRYGVLVSSSLTDDLKIQIVGEFLAKKQAAAEEGKKLSARTFSLSMGLGSKAVKTWKKLMTLGIIEHSNSEYRNTTAHSSKYFDERVQFYCSNHAAFTKEGINKRLFAEIYRIPSKAFTKAVNEKLGIAKKSVQRLSKSKVEELKNAFAENPNLSSSAAAQQLGLKPDVVAYWKHSIAGERNRNFAAEKDSQPTED